MLKLVLGIFTVAVVLSASLVIAFPTVHYSENIQQDWTFFMDEHQYEYASVVDFSYSRANDFSFAASLDPNSGQYTDRLHWGHSTPTLLPLPTDEILRARLYVGGVWVSQDGRETTIEGLFGWDPTNRRFVDNSENWATGSSQNVNWIDGALNVDLDAGDGYIRVDQAVFMVDYEGADASAVPEPATVALLVVGLIGIGLIQLRRRRIENVS
jgi:hypothetical protein